jgi:hypothetical protein
MLSHWIRGPKGKDATKKDIRENLDKNIAIGTEIKAYLIDWEKMDEFPKMDLYIPAEHDEFVQIAFDKEYVSEEQILDVDCTIIDQCKLVIALGDHSKSRGMKIELDYAENNSIVILYMPELTPETIKTLKFSLKLLLS